MVRVRKDSSDRGIFISVTAEHEGSAPGVKPARGNCGPPVLSFKQNGRCPVPEGDRVSVLIEMIRADDPAVFVITPSDCRTSCRKCHLLILFVKKSHEDDISVFIVIFSDRRIPLRICKRTAVLIAHSLADRHPVLVVLLFQPGVSLKIGDQCSRGVKTPDCHNISGIIVLLLDDGSCACGRSLFPGRSRPVPIIKIRGADLPALFVVLMCHLGIITARRDNWTSGHVHKSHGSRASVFI